MKNLEIKLYVSSLFLLDVLDQTEGETKFKHKIRYHINGLSKELEKLVDVEIDQDALSFLLTDSWTALEDSIDKKLEVKPESP